ncbi:FtsW/RodA/SpoVE family cell cycle protein [Arthrobacter sp. MYb211]|uniref:FtsW/RodA/SpoVE family cell cycle protein n=1 Tax=Micrococcaceae TaxID=1268 RepID=UPI000BB994D7|nr:MULTISPECIES: FtsW/RodA/SpoVE family cell cycle protein [Micrococcaceae]PCC30597.1 cell division protein [Glutamicibacter sp. BW80]PQZ97693.1 FtsW/RodA/SpoVE family cell cycle protein [Arthrobacter sp. MYb224]PRA04075.1 FtsW/RodA/SpoVE family cell cycle protein [Arthrobacter sp. MYb229]PRA10126.1 FtsW/RodA/SpoVE family cell cycle protein [Arthrobacter sp. MYb221]PRB52013.1 FtsW/RodA/SpoVE family cell cycle protein [Arthrobacter sp. MYb216]
MSELHTAPVPRRNLELVLLLLALSVGAAAFFLVGSSSDSDDTKDFFVQTGVLAGLALLLHIMLRIFAKYADPVILPITVALNALGLAMIHRIDLAKTTSQSMRQLLWTAIAVIIAAIVLWAIRDHRVLRRFTYIALLASIILLLLPMIPGFGVTINGARIWVRLGAFSMQPGELAKITLSIFFAGYLSSNRDLILMAGRKIGPLQLPRRRDMAPMVVAWILSIGVLVVQRDLGSSILFFGLFIVMIYVATARISWVLIGLLMVAAGGVFAATTMSHVTRRVDVWLNAFDPEIYQARGGSMQIVEGLFGMADGGLFGTGLGEGSPYRVPLANSDMIIASFGEELGLIGLTAIILLYMLLISRGLRAALGSRDTFGKLLAAGLSFTLGLQCIVIIGGVTRLIPLTGLATPFMAAGGSSLLANWIIISLLLMISHNSRRPMTGGVGPTDEIATPGATTPKAVKNV